VPLDLCVVPLPPLPALPELLCLSWVLWLFPLLLGGRVEPLWLSEVLADTVLLDLRECLDVPPLLAAGEFVVLPDEAGISS
jgi:hypothetical protein